jgi:SulP family sulfate permease
VVRGPAADEKVRAVVLDAQTISFVDITASQMLDELREYLSGRGVTLLLARDVGQVRDVLRHARPDDAGEDRVFATVEEAVEAEQSAMGSRGRSP